VTGEWLKLTTYYGERDRVGRRFLADALSDIHARRELAVSLVMRGVEGFGAKHRLRTDRLLTLSEDLPLVSVAVDARPRIEAALAEVAALRFDGLVTLERAQLMTGARLLADLHDAAKLTVYVGRHERVGGTPAHQAVVASLHRHGVAGATVLLGIDGMLHGERQRARFFSGNAGVPLMIVAIGSGPTIAAALQELEGTLPGVPLTIERVRVCKRDGVLLEPPPGAAGTDPSGLQVWQKLMIYAGEQSRHRGAPLSPQLVRALRTAGAAGATSLRGIWGYHGDHAPHGDALWQLRRRVPVVTVVIDTPERIRRWFEIVDRLTDETGLVTSEFVPALRATGPGIDEGGLRLAGPLG
jgi:PII-like signaling protein